MFHPNNVSLFRWQLGLVTYNVPFTERFISKIYYNLCLQIRVSDFHDVVNIFCNEYQEYLVWTYAIGKMFGLNQLVLLCYNDPSYHLSLVLY